MSLLAVSNFLALLALVALAASVATLAVRLAAGPIPAAGGLLTGLRQTLGPYGLWLAWLVALTATAGSLYFSEVAGLVPCELCWYQRIAMYPLAAILLVAALRTDRRVRPYATVLAGIGAVVAAYHVLLQRLPGLPSAVCSLEAPCTAIELERFGFVTIPLMALIGFVTILVVLWQVAPPEHEAGEP